MYILFKQQIAANNTCLHTQNRKLNNKYLRTNKQSASFSLFTFHSRKRISCASPSRRKRNENEINENSVDTQTHKKINVYLSIMQNATWQEFRFSDGLSLNPILAGSFTLHRSSTCRQTQAFPSTCMENQYQRISLALCIFETKTMSSAILETRGCSQIQQTHTRARARSKIICLRCERQSRSCKKKMFASVVTINWIQNECGKMR